MKVKYKSIEECIESVNAQPLLFGAKVLPSDFYEARYTIVNGEYYLYPAIREVNDNFRVDPDRTTEFHVYHVLRCPIGNEKGLYWYPCETGGEDIDGMIDFEALRHANHIDRCILDSLLRMSEADRKKTGYMISHWVFKFVDGELIPVNPKANGKIRCCITAVQSAVWTIVHKSNGSTKSNGERVAYAATGFMPIDRRDRTMFDYHAMSRVLAQAKGNFCKTNQTAKGFEIEGFFFPLIGLNDWKHAVPSLDDKVEYDGVYLNRRGVIGTLLLKLAIFTPLVTKDATVDFEILTVATLSLNALKDNLCVLNKILYNNAGSGTHIHASPINSNIENLFLRFDMFTEVFPMAQMIFEPLTQRLIEESAVQDIPLGDSGEFISRVEEVFGRSFNFWADSEIGFDNHHCWLNVTPMGTLENRLAKYRDELQYLRLINMSCEFVLLLNEAINQRVTVEEAQVKALQIWEKTAKHETRTDKNAQKTPNKQGVRRRNIA